MSNTALMASADTLASYQARIINIGSVDGIRVPSLETYAYSASKAGLHQLTRVFAKQLGQRGITSNALACGEFAREAAIIARRKLYTDLMNAAHRPFPVQEYVPACTHFAFTLLRAILSHGSALADLNYLSRAISQ